MRSRILLAVQWGKRIWCALYIGGLCFLIGCASSVVRPAGFLTCYSSMQRSQMSPHLYFYQNSSATLSEYSTIIIEPVVVVFRPGNQHAAIDPAILKKLADELDEKVRRSLASRYTIVTEPATKTIRVRVAITDVVPAKPLLNIEPATKILGLGLGGASMEAEFFDAKTNQTVFALIDSRAGKRRQYFSGLKKWGHTEEILSQWAEMLAHGIEAITRTSW